nr:UDP-N-acetylglucosamine 2-epimerase (non-hydrolyzing) [Roseobacter litoralis]
MLVFGTRPEAIKMAPVVKALQEDPGTQTCVCVTGQHREMLDQVLDVFSIVPDHNLRIMKSGQTLFDISAGILTGLQAVVAEEKPDVILVHGDTTTTLAASVVAYYSDIPLGHVEAGLRTGNLRSPWPEEGNRRVAGALARWHFASTESARQNLLRENVPDTNILVTGNTVIDALLMAQEILETDETIRQSTEQKLSGIDPGKEILLVTGHRRESFGGGFERICAALGQIASDFPDLQIVYPVHLNPNVRQPVFDLLGARSNIRLMEPLDYLPFVRLMARSKIILTDSGGIQEEAPSLGKPVLVMRDTTERPEAIEAGTARLVGTDPEMIVSTTSELLQNATAYETMSTAHNPYGDGKASERIVGFMNNE